MNKRQRKKRAKHRFERVAQTMASMISGFIGQKLAQQSLAHAILLPSSLRLDFVASWRDDADVVHAVNARTMAPDVDLGRETACEVASWNPDGPHLYPAGPTDLVDCMTCIVRTALG